MKHLNLISPLDNAQSIRDITYKEVVIIGNGPSGISLSYFLAGHLPYWKINEISSHPDELLKARLALLDADKSLIEQNLCALTDGLEGRTTNPISLLFDSLQHPGADLGFQLPCMLDYKYHKDKEIDHVVLGKGHPGGSWHRMDPNLRTLSLSAWMSLPNMNFDDWERKYKLPVRHNNVCNVGQEREISEEFSCDNVTDEVKTRALISRVAEYYNHYVTLMNLDKYFRNDTIVANIRQLKETEKKMHKKFENAQWLVCGYDKQKKRPYAIACKHVALANGGSDLANRLGVRGENKSLPWLTYDLPQLEKAIENITTDEKKAMKPVLIIGAGLSAADAVVVCRNAGIKVIHVYRSVAAGFFGLPPKYFPEYNEVHTMMKTPEHKYDLYQALPQCTLKEIKSSNGARIVTIQNLQTDEMQDFEISHCAIFIGSRPDLSFISNIQTKPSTTMNLTDNLTDDIIQKLSRCRQFSWIKNLCEKCRHLNLCFGLKRQSIMANMENCCNQHKSVQCECDSLLNDIKSKVDDNTFYGVGIGDDPQKPIDCKNNPIAVNKYTNEMLHVPGAFALGPLVGDNFVRFIAGGALAICAALHDSG